jgi:ribonucleoside-diphosphate reductase alpha chain
MLSPNAQRIFNLKYAKVHPNGRKEEWKEAVTRVADYVASAERTEQNQYRLMAFFVSAMYDKSFIPGGRILANAGTNIKNLFNCFVLPIEDSRQSIYSTLKNAAEIFAWGGGVGYNFSHLRAAGSPVKSTGGKASGPLSFMSLFDQTGEVIAQASRRGAQMGILNCDHPDIVDFINFKNKLNSRNSRLMKEYVKNLKNAHLDTDGKPYFDVMQKTLSDDQLTHFNLSVAVTDKFMLESEELLKLMAENAWQNGDPGLFFVDRANQDNLAPYLGTIDATNPCGEVPLLPYEACCLGSINLYNCVFDKLFDWDYFENLIRLGVRFLDNVHDLNETPIPEINKICKETRRLGLGVMGLADCLAEMGMPYDSKEAFDFADKLAQFLGKTAWQASIDLAEEKGPFPAFDEDKINWSLLDKFNLPHKPVRNIAVTSIAPTGTIALLANVSSGIEPYFSIRYKRNITEGLGNTVKDTIEYEIPLIQIKRDQGWTDEDIKKIFKTAHQIHWKDHIRMQVIWQNCIDNAVSKTINMPYEATIEDVMDAYAMAWQLGLKGITIYRDGSKLFQILEKNPPKELTKMQFGFKWD